jgi:sugar lactone lactonase YvrE
MHVRRPAALVTVALTTVALIGLTAALGAPAYAAGTASITDSITDPHEIAHFDVSALQQPENLALEPNGSVDVTFNRARQVARVSPDGTYTILATLPQDTAGNTIVSGIVRTADGTLYVNYNAGSQSGIWRIPPNGGTAQQIVAIPSARGLNGLAYDPAQRALYATDSSLGLVWKISPAQGTATIWAQGTPLQPTTASGKGANGLKLHDGAVWVSNTTLGTLLRIPIQPDGTAGTTNLAAQGITGIDDFAFAPDGQVVAAQNALSEASIVNVNTGAHTLALTATDGLSNPTSVAIRGNTVYITSGAYFTHTDPNLLAATLTR